MATSMTVCAIVASSSPKPTKPVARSHQPQTAVCRRSLLGMTAGLMFVPLPSLATGLESYDFPIDLPTQPDFLKERAERNQKVIDSANEKFQNSEFLKNLKERSDANRDTYKKELADRYCKRLAEEGVGDCAGLRLIPGATKSGIQKKPEWMLKLLGQAEEGAVSE